MLSTRERFYQCVHDCMNLTVEPGSESQYRRWHSRRNGQSLKRLQVRRSRNQSYRDTRISLLHGDRTACGAYPVSYPVGRGVTLTTSIHSVPRLRMPSLLPPSRRVYTTRCLIKHTTNFPLPRNRVPNAIDIHLGCYRCGEERLGT